MHVFREITHKSYYLLNFCSGIIQDRCFFCLQSDGSVEGTGVPVSISINLSKPYVLVMSTRPIKIRKLFPEHYYPNVNVPKMAPLIKNSGGFNSNISASNQQHLK